MYFYFPDTPRRLVQGVIYLYLTLRLVDSALMKVTYAV